MSIAKRSSTEDSSIGRGAAWFTLIVIAAAVAYYTVLFALVG